MMMRRSRRRMMTSKRLKTKRLPDRGERENEKRIRLALVTNYS